MLKFSTDRLQALLWTSQTGTMSNSTGFQIGGERYIQISIENNYSTIVLDIGAVQGGARVGWVGGGFRTECEKNMRALSMY